MPRSIKDVKQDHAGRLMKLPGVVSVGIGLDDDGEAAILVGLEAPNPDTEAALPRSLEGHPVAVRVVGKIKAQ